MPRPILHTSLALCCLLASHSLSAQAEVAEARLDVSYVNREFPATSLPRCLPGPEADPWGILAEDPSKRTDGRFFDFVSWQIKQGLGVEGRVAVVPEGGEVVVSAAGVSTSELAREARGVLEVWLPRVRFALDLLPAADDGLAPVVPVDGFERFVRGVPPSEWGGDCAGGQHSVIELGDDDERARVRIEPHPVAGGSQTTLVLEFESSQALAWSSREVQMVCQGLRGDDQEVTPRGLSHVLLLLGEPEALSEVQPAADAKVRDLLHAHLGAATLISEGPSGTIAVPTLSGGQHVLLEADADADGNLIRGTVTTLRWTRGVEDALATVDARRLELAGEGLTEDAGEPVVRDAVEVGNRVRLFEAEGRRPAVSLRLD